MHYVSTASILINIRNLFTKTSSAHSYNTILGDSGATSGDDAIFLGESLQEKVRAL